MSDPQALESYVSMMANFSRWKCPYNGVRCGVLMAINEFAHGHAITTIAPPIIGNQWSGRAKTAGCR